MNQTDNFSQNAIFCLVQLTSVNSAFTLVVCFILYIPVFPIYVYVFRKNRDKEKASKVFPMLQHFYRTTIFQYLFISISLISGVYTRFYPEWTTEYPTFALLHTWLRLYDFILVFYEVHHWIIILLAVQRFVLYFELWVKLDLSPRAINVVLMLLYVFGYLKFSIFAIPILVFHNEPMSLIYRGMLIYESIIIHVLLFASASLYIPISVSIRRKSHLVSVIKNKPDRFILYQTIGLAAFKVSSLRLHIYEQFEHVHRQGSIYHYGNTSDFVITPVMIQMSYLFSNKRNLDTIKNIFKRNNRTLPSISHDAARTASVDN